MCLCLKRLGLTSSKTFESPKHILTCSFAFSKGGVKGEGIGECSCVLAHRFVARKPISCLSSRPPLASLVSAFRLPTVFCYA